MSSSVFPIWLPKAWRDVKDLSSRAETTRGNERVTAFGPPDFGWLDHPMECRILSREPLENECRVWRACPCSSCPTEIVAIRLDEAWGAQLRQDRQWDDQLAIWHQVAKRSLRRWVRAQRGCRQGPPELSQRVRGYDSEAGSKAETTALKEVPDGHPHDLDTIKMDRIMPALSNIR